MKKQLSLPGLLMILAAVTFWISWFLMPDPGTTDTQHILAIVKQSRDAVISSVTTQLISAVLYLVALFLLVKNIPLTRASTTGIILLGIGAMGMCADAFFHLLAWYMTDESVTMQKDVIQVMEFMQTHALIFLVPLMLPFFIGCFFIASGLRSQGLISKIPVWLFITAILVGILGNGIVKISGHTLPGVMITVLGFFAAGQIFIGYQISSFSQKTNELLIVKTQSFLKN